MVFFLYKNLQTSLKLQQACSERINRERLGNIMREMYKYVGALLIRTLEQPDLVTEIFVFLDLCRV